MFSKKFALMILGVLLMLNYLYSGLRIVSNAFVSVVFQILEVAPSLYMVELRKSEGDTLEFHKVSLMHKLIYVFAYMQPGATKLPFRQDLGESWTHCKSLPCICKTFARALFCDLNQ